MARRMERTARVFAQRKSALERFDAWAGQRSSALAPAAALEAIGAIGAIGAIYEILPEDSRRRPVDATGVARMHSLMRIWSTAG